MKEIKGQVEEVRKGRFLFVRQFQIGSSEEKNVRQCRHLQILAVHGLCASERQFHPLWSELHHLLLQKKGHSHRHLASKDVSDAAAADQDDNDDKYNINYEDDDIRMVCHSYDWMACGQSPILNQWHEYETQQTVDDLQCFMDRYINVDTPLYIVAHSYAPTIVLRALQSKPRSNLKGLIVISSAIRRDKDNSPVSPPVVVLPSSSSTSDSSMMTSSRMTNIAVPPDGGHWIMKLPLWILHRLQQKMTDAFCEAAVYKDYHDIQQKIRNDSNQNDMYMAKAYHRHTQWIHANEIEPHESSSMDHPLPPVLVIHGAQDGVIPVELGQDVADVLRAKAFVKVEKASHFPMVERPQQVSQAIYNFIIMSSSS